MKVQCKHNEKLKLNKRIETLQSPHTANRCINRETIFGVPTKMVKKKKKKLYYKTNREQNSYWLERLFGRAPGVVGI